MTCSHNWMLYISEQRGKCIECSTELVGPVKPSECPHFWIDLSSLGNPKRKQVCYFCDTVTLEDFEDEPYWN